MFDAFACGQRIDTIIDQIGDGTIVTHAQFVSALSGAASDSTDSALPGDQRRMQEDSINTVLSVGRAYRSFYAEHPRIMFEMVAEEGAEA